MTVTTGATVLQLVSADAINSFDSSSTTSLRMERTEVISEGQTSVAFFRDRLMSVAKTRA